MLASRFGVAVLAAVVLAACVGNPYPVAPAVAPVVAASSVSELVPPEQPPGPIASPAWESGTARGCPHGRRRRTLRGAAAAGVAGAACRRACALCRVRGVGLCGRRGTAPPRLPAEGGGFREPLGCSLFSGPLDLLVRESRVVGAEAAHDAGLCRRAEARAAFAADPDNRLYVSAVMAAARAEAIARGDGEWLPGRNLCWYVGTQLRVRRRYGLSVSPWEARLFEAVLRGCPDVAPSPRCDLRGGAVW